MKRTFPFYAAILLLLPGLSVPSHADVIPSNAFPVTGDFDGDKKADQGWYNPVDGNWHITNSSNGQVVGQQWGVPGDVPLMGDFDGDGKTDYAVYRPSTGEWYFRLSTQSYVIGAGNWFFAWGMPGDIPVPADYDGDGKTDIAVYRPSTGEWLFLLSSQGYVVGAGNWYFQWGVPGDLPYPADYDGDGKADIGVYRPSTGEWLFRLSTQGYVVTAGNWYFQWGVGGDIPVPADYDGDGKADIAVYRPSTGEWYLRLSTKDYVIGAGNWYFQWGIPGDIPKPTDFDGDHKADLAVWRPSALAWFINMSSLKYADLIEKIINGGISGSLTEAEQITMAQNAGLIVEGNPGDLESNIYFVDPATHETLLTVSHNPEVHADPSPAKELPFKSPVCKFDGVKLLFRRDGSFDALPCGVNVHVDPKIPEQTKYVQLGLEAIDSQLGKNCFQNYTVEPTDIWGVKATIDKSDLYVLCFTKEQLDARAKQDGFTPGGVANLYSPKGYIAAALGINPSIGSIYINCEYMDSVLKYDKDYGNPGFKPEQSEATHIILHEGSHELGLAHCMDDPKSRNCSDPNDPMGYSHSASMSSQLTALEIAALRKIIDHPGENYLAGECTDQISNGNIKNLDSNSCTINNIEAYPYDGFTTCDTDRGGQCYRTQNGITAHICCCPLFVDGTHAASSALCDSGCHDYPIAQPCCEPPPPPDPWPACIAYCNGGEYACTMACVYQCGCGYAQDVASCMATYCKNGVPPDGNPVSLCEMNPAFCPFTEIPPPPPPPGGGTVCLCIDGMKTSPDDPACSGPCQ